MGGCEANDSEHKIDFGDSNTAKNFNINENDITNNLNIRNKEEKNLVNIQTINIQSKETSAKTNSLDNFYETLTKYQNDLDCEKKKNEKLKNENQDLLANYKDLEGKFNTIEIQKNQLEKDNFEKTKIAKEQIAKFADINANLSNSLKILEENNKNLNANLQAILVEKNNLINQLNVNQDKIKNLNIELADEKNKNLGFTQQISKLTIDSQTKEKEISNLKSQILDKDKNILSLTSQFQAKDSENLTLKKEVEKKTQEYSLLKNEYDKLVPITVGLDNIGATCYMNATIQSFSSIRELSLFFKENYVPNKDKKMSKEYYIVIQNLWDIKNHGKSYAPNSFKEVLSQLNPMFAGINANDSKDLINFLLEKLHEELNLGSNKNFNSKSITPFDQKNETKMLGIFLKDYTERYKSIISNLFYGTIQTKSQCTNCQNIKYNFQVFSFLEFPLQQVNDFCLNNGMRKNFNGTGNPDIDLYECFWHYQSISTMNGINQIYCNDCGKNCDAYYGTFLYSMPKYFIINLNRGKNAVYKCNVKFPEILKLDNFVRYNTVNSTFQLKAVICHIGPSSMGGHFIAYCRHYMDNNWYKYNDSTVTKCVEKKEYLYGMPYILFYQAIDTN